MMGPGGRVATDRAKRTEWLALVYMMMAGTYDTMSGHGEAGDAHRVVCPYNILAERVCILAAVEKLVQD